MGNYAYSSKEFVTMKLFISALIGSALECGFYGPPPAPRTTTTTTTTTTTRAPTACEIRRADEEQKYQNGEQTGIVRCTSSGAWLPTVTEELAEHVIVTNPNTGNDDVKQFTSWCITTNDTVMPAGSRIDGTLVAWTTRAAAGDRDAECRQEERNIQ